jgi:hypothetical protein
VAGQEGVALTQDDVAPWVTLLAEQVGLTEAAAADALRADPEAARDTLLTAHRAKVIDHLLRHLVVDLSE